MSGVYPYCLVTAGCQPPAGLRGLRGHLVESYDVEPFTVWTSAEDGPPEPDIEAIMQHHEVVRAATEAAAALPIRFGAWAADHAVLADRIHRERDRFDATLAAVAGCVELGVTLASAPTGAPAGTSAPPAVGTPADGRAFLRELSRSYTERRRAREELRALLDGLRDALAELDVEERVRSSPGLLSVAHLVARGDEARYRDIVGAYARAQRCAERVRVSGPWPPYSFVEP